MKDRYLWIGIFIVICSMFVNHFYLQSKKLVEPIFLQHYYEAHVDEDEIQLQFYFLNDKDEPVEVSYVTVDDVVMNPIDVPFPSMGSKKAYRPDRKKEFTHHTLQSVTLSLPTHSIPINKGSDDVWTFNNMKVTFTNGETMDANIGEVRVYGKLPVNEALKNTYDSSRSEGFSQWYAVTTKPLTIEGISIPYSEQIGTDFFVQLFLGPNITTAEEIQTYSEVPKWYNDEFLASLWYETKENDLNGVSLNDAPFPSHLNESDFMKIFMYFNPESNIYFNFYITIYGSTVNGEHFEYAVPINSNNQPNLTEDDVNKIIEQRMGGYSE